MSGQVLPISQSVAILFVLFFSDNVNISVKDRLHFLTSVNFTGIARVLIDS